MWLKLKVKDEPGSKMNRDENWKSDHCHREFFSHVIIQAMMYSRNGAVYRNLTCIYSGPIQSMDLLQYK